MEPPREYKEMSNEDDLASRFGEKKSYPMFENSKSTQDQKQPEKQSEKQPEIKPMDIQPEIKPMDIQPEIKPTDIQPEIKPMDIQPEIKPTDIQPPVSLWDTNILPHLKSAELDINQFESICAHMKQWMKKTRKSFK